MTAMIRVTRVMLGSRYDGHEDVRCGGQRQVRDRTRSAVQVAKLVRGTSSLSDTLFVRRRGRRHEVFPAAVQAGGDRCGRRVPPRQRDARAGQADQQQRRDLPPRRGAGPARPARRRRRRPVRGSSGCRRPGSGMRRSALISRPYDRTEDSRATATPPISSDGWSSTAAAPLAPNGRTSSAATASDTASPPVPGTSEPRSGADQDVTGPAEAGPEGEQQARRAGPSPPASRPSSPTPAPASSAHSRSTMRRVCTRASSSGPRNSTVTQTPSGTVRSAR